MQIDRRALLSLAAASASPAALAADVAPMPEPTEVAPLWPGRPPGAPAALPKESVVERVTGGFIDRYAIGIAQPRMFVIRPERPNGAACLVCPGGGYERVVIDKESFEVGHRLARAGVTSFILRYRLPADGWAHGEAVPLQDAQRAIRLIRANAAKYRIDPKRICVMGFSAAGHMAAALATLHGREVYAPVDAADRQSARPDLSALMYPVIHMDLPLTHPGSRKALLGATPTPEQEAAWSLQRFVTAETPPTFLVHALNDPSVPVENSLDYLAALRAAKVAAEAHLFEEGKHGFAIKFARGKPAAAWPDLFVAWATRHGWLKG